MAGYLKGNYYWRYTHFWLDNDYGRKGFFSWVVGEGCAPLFPTILERKEVKWPCLGSKLPVCSWLPIGTARTWDCLAWKQCLEGSLFFYKQNLTHKELACQLRRRIECLAFLVCPKCFPGLLQLAVIPPEIKMFGIRFHEVLYRVQSWHLLSCGMGECHRVYSDPLLLADLRALAFFGTSDLTKIPPKYMTAVCPPLESPGWNQLSNEKNPTTLHYTGCLIGIHILVYYNPHTIG